MFQEVQYTVRNCEAGGDTSANEFNVVKLYDTMEKFSFIKAIIFIV